MNHDVQSKKKKFLNRLSGQKGFMITEVLMTTLIIVITMVAIIPIFMMGIKSGKVSKDRTVEMAMAQKEIERFNQDNFLNVLNYIQAQINNDTNFKAFKDGGDTSSFNSAQTIYVNSSTGETVTTLKPGFNTVLVAKKYTFLKGEETQMDDLIQLAVRVQLTGQSRKPLVLTALLSRDKR